MAESGNDYAEFGLVTVTDNSQLFTTAIDHILQRVLLVGIPQENSSSGRSGEEPTNAELAFIHTYGSPINRIPARPFMEPAIEEKETKERVAEYYGKAVKSAFNGDFAGADANLGKAGMIARNAIVRYIDDSSHFVPNAPMTIALKGSDKPLIDTGSLRTSITYVIRTEGDN